LPPFAANAAHQRVRAATGTWKTRDTARGELTHMLGGTCRNRAQFFSGRPGL
jgi:nuclear transport factor 2 (NTF2) superfamily protein